MKKTVILLGLMSVVLISCKKKYDCNCSIDITASSSGVSQEISYTSNKEVEGSSKKKAQDACDDYKKEAETNAADSIYTGGVQGVEVNTVVNCTLKKK